MVRRGTCRTQSVRSCARRRSTRKGRTWLSGRRCAEHSAPSRDPEGREKKVMEGIQHLRFCAKIYSKQVEQGRYFLREHPDRAWSWKLDFMVDLLKLK
eukprot:4897781-Pyramimonas_sp.AAC.1